jgi:hypothetical protein
MKGLKVISILTIFSVKKTQAKTGLPFGHFTLFTPSTNADIILTGISLQQIFCCLMWIVEM